MSGRFRSILFVSFFQSSLVVAVLMIYGNQKHHRLLVFKIRVLLKGAEIYESIWWRSSAGVLHLEAKSVQI